jgi:hypothetical protein
VEGTIEVMAMSFNTFPPPQMRNHSQFIPYNGPPKPKQFCQISSPKNIPYSEEFPDIDDILRNKSGLNTQPMNGGDFKPVPYGVEILDLTCSGRYPLAKWKILHLSWRFMITDVNTDEIHDEFGIRGVRDNASSDNGLSPHNKRENEEFEQYIITGSCADDTKDESSNRPVSKGNSQGKWPSLIQISA